MSDETISSFRTRVLSRQWLYFISSSKRLKTHLRIKLRVAFRTWLNTGRTSQLLSTFYVNIVQDSKIKLPWILLSKNRTEKAPFTGIPVMTAYTESEYATYINTYITHLADFTVYITKRWKLCARHKFICLHVYTPFK